MNTYQVCPDGNVTNYVYDRLNRQIEASGQGRPTTSYFYDADANLKTVTDPRGFVTTYAYDESNRTKPGQTGIDANWVNEEIEPPGMDAVELKPFTQSSLKGFKTQMNNWYGNGTVQDGDVVQLWGYDQQGNVMAGGRNYSFGDDGLTYSIAPGYGFNGPPALTPSLVWGAGAGAFSSTSNSNVKSTCWDGIGQ